LLNARRFVGGSLAGHPKPGDSGCPNGLLYERDAQRIANGFIGDCPHGIDHALVGAEDANETSGTGVHMTSSMKTGLPSTTLTPCAPRMASRIGIVRVKNAAAKSVSVVVIWKLSTWRPCLIDLVGLILLPRPQQQRQDGNAKDAAEVQDSQPEILLGCVLLAEVKLECFSQALQV